MKDILSLKFWKQISDEYSNVSVSTNGGVAVWNGDSAILYHILLSNDMFVQNSRIDIDLIVKPSKQSKFPVFNDDVPKIGIRRIAWSPVFNSNSSLLTVLIGSRDLLILDVTQESLAFVTESINVSLTGLSILLNVSDVFVDSCLISFDWNPESFVDRYGDKYLILAVLDQRKVTILLFNENFIAYSAGSFNCSNICPIDSNAQLKFQPEMNNCDILEGKVCTLVLATAQSVHTIKMHIQLLQYNRRDIRANVTFDIESPLVTFNPQSPLISSLVLSPSGLAVISRGLDMYLINTNQDVAVSGKVITLPRIHRSNVCCIVYVSSSSSSSTGAGIKDNQHNTQSVGSVLTHRSNPIFISCGVNEGLCCWEVTENGSVQRLPLEFELSTPTLRPWTVSLDPTKKVLYCVSSIPALHMNSKIEQSNINLTHRHALLHMVPFTIHHNVNRHHFVSKTDSLELTASTSTIPDTLAQQRTWQWIDTLLSSFIDDVTFSSKSSMLGMTLAFTLKLRSMNHASFATASELVPLLNYSGDKTNHTENSITQSYTNVVDYAIAFCIVTAQTPKLVDPSLQAVGSVTGICFLILAIFIPSINFVYQLQRP